MPALETAASKPARLDLRERAVRNPAVPHNMKMLSMNPIGRAGPRGARGMPFSITIFMTSSVAVRTPNIIAALKIESQYGPRVLAMKITAMV